MTALTYPKFQVQNISGVNASSGKVYFYSSGTSTAKDTYSDIALTILNTNPVVLNARGEADIYLDGEYKIVLELNGSIEWTEDAYKTPADRVGDALRADLASTDTGKGASLVVFESGSTVQDLDSTATEDGVNGSNLVNFMPFAAESNIENHAFARENLLRFIPLSLHDAIRARTDSTNLATYIQNAFNSWIAIKSKGYAPAGKYTVGTQVDWTRTGNEFPPLLLEGDGMYKTTFVNAVSGGAMIKIDGGQSGTDFIRGNRLANFNIEDDGAATTSDGIQLSGCWHTKVSQVSIDGLSGVAINIGGIVGENPDNTATALLQIDACRLNSNASGIINELNNNAPLIEVSSTSIQNNSISGIEANSSYLIIRGSSVSFNGLSNQGSAVGGITVDQQSGSTYRSKGCLIENTELDSNYPHQVKYASCTAPVIRGCSIQMSTQYTTLTGGFPEAQIILGGTDADGRCWQPKIQDCRMSINNTDASAYNNHAIFKLQNGSIAAKIERITYNLSDGGTGMGSTYFAISEDTKAATANSTYDLQKLYVNYDYPLGNFPDGKIDDVSFAVQYPKSFGQQNQSTQFGWAIGDDAFKTIVLPANETNSANYGVLTVTIGGDVNKTALIGYRAEASPQCFLMTIASGISVTTGALNGTTGVDTELTISVDTSGNLYIENRTGSTQNVQIALIITTGYYDQLS